MTQFYEGYDNEKVASAIEMELNGLKKFEIYLKDYNTKNGKLQPILLFLPFAIIPFVLPSLFCSLTSYDYNEMVTVLQENIKYGHFLTLLEGTFLLPVGTWISITDYLLHRRNIEVEQALNYEKESLKNDLIYLKENLIIKKEANKKEIGISNEEEVSKKVSDVGNLYYQVGYYYSKYAKYYQKGILREKLQNRYDIETISKIEALLENEGTYRKIRIKS